jgi:hypothetical protein
VAKTAVFGNHRIRIESPMSIPDIQKGMAELFPELKDAVAFDKGDEVHFVPKSTMMQNRLNIELQKRKEQYLLDDLRRQAERNISEIGYMPGTRADKIKSGMIDASAISVHHTGNWHPAKLKRYSGGRWRDLETGEVSRAEKYDRVKETINTWFDPPDEYSAEITGQYASRGGYEHLVGKKAKIIETNEDLEVYVVKVEDDDTEYVIRMKDIKL